MDNEIQRRIWIKKLNINATLRGFPDEVYLFEKRLNRLATLWKLDIHDAALEFLMIGIEEAEKRIEDDHFHDLDDEHKRLISISLMHKKIAESNQLLEDLMPIFKYYGAEGFEEWCLENKFDVQEFYRLYQESLQGLSWSKRARKWIEFQMDKANDPVPISEIKIMAKSDGILEKDESNWGALNKHAQRMNITNRPYGFWFDE